MIVFWCQSTHWIEKVHTSLEFGKGEGCSQHPIRSLLLSLTWANEHWKDLCRNGCWPFCIWACVVWHTCILSSLCSLPFLLFRKKKLRLWVETVWMMEEKAHDAFVNVLAVQYYGVRNVLFLHLWAMFDCRRWVVLWSYCQCCHCPIDENWTIDWICYILAHCMFRHGGFPSFLLNSMLSCL